MVQSALMCVMCACLRNHIRFVFATERYPESASEIVHGHSIYDLVFANRKEFRKVAIQIRFVSVERQIAHLTQVNNYVKIYHHYTDAITVEMNFII